MHLQAYKQDHDYDNHVIACRMIQIYRNGQKYAYENNVTIRYFLYTNRHKKPQKGQSYKLSSSSTWYKSTQKTEHALYEANLHNHHLRH